MRGKRWWKIHDISVYIDFIKYMYIYTYCTDTHTNTTPLYTPTYTTDGIERKKRATTTHLMMETWKGKEKSIFPISMHSFYHVVVYQKNICIYTYKFYFINCLWKVQVLMDIKHNKRTHLSSQIQTYGFFFSH